MRDLDGHADSASRGDADRLLSDPAFYVPESDEATEPQPDAPPSFSAAPEPEPEADADTPTLEIPPVRDYQLRGGEDVADLPVVRDYSFHSAADEPLDDSPREPGDVIPARSLLDDAPVIEEKKPGFFARLFGAGSKPEPRVEPSFDEPALDAAEIEAAELEPAETEPAETEAADIEPDEIEPVSYDAAPPADPISYAAPVPSSTPVEPPPRLDRPSLEFFMRVDRAPEPVDADPEESEAELEPSLDDALPMDATPVADELPAEEPPAVREPHREGWTPVIPPPPEREPGFFSRLIRRLSKSQPVQSDTSDFEPWAPAASAGEAVESEPVTSREPDWSEARQDPAALEAAEQALASFAQPVFDQPDTGFGSVDDALPASEDYAPREVEPEPEVAGPSRDARETLETTFTDFSRFAPPPPKAEPETDPFAATIPPDVEEPFNTLQMEPVVPPPVSDSRSTLEMVALDDEDTDTRSMVPPTPPDVTAAQEAGRGPFFVPKFRAFYNEIVSQKEQKAEFTAGFATAVMDYTADLTPAAAAASLSKRLKEALDLQAAEAMWMGGEAAARFPDAQYAMAALADEIFTYLDWPGREAWPRHLVEQQLFKSNAKDVEFFKRVDKLLKNEGDHPSPAAKDLARMYLLVLAAGFQGKYRPFGLNRPLAEYRRRLYEFVSQKDPLLLYGEERKLFPEATEHVVVGRAVSRFTMLQQWAAVLVILLIGYAVISQVAWNRVSADLKDVTARVEAANNSSTSDGVAGEPR